MANKKPKQNATELVTRDSLIADFRNLGLQAGQTVLVHTSMSKLGWVNGGAAGQAFEEEGNVTIGQVTGATCRLMSQKRLVDYAVDWFDVFRKR
jgi:aminoglycoside N3'-acetyltransferase